MYTIITQAYKTTHSYHEKLCNAVREFKAQATALNPPLYIDVYHNQDIVAQFTNGILYNHDHYTEIRDTEFKLLYQLL